MNQLVSINNTYESFQQLISFYERNKEKMFENIQLELRRFFCANIAAALGAVLDELIGNLNDVEFHHIDDGIENILLRNDFLSYYGRPRLIDDKNTTIRFQKLKPKDGKFFKNYVIEELIEGHTNDLPNMSAGVKERIVEGIYEIFANAQIHSNSDFIYTCGQFFPTKNKIEFTIVDTGIGFRDKVNQRFGSHLSSAQAIRWAVQDTKTTKDTVSGGIGLAVLREFIGMNKGKMQIVSKDGFYQYDCDGEVTRSFNGEFPGTIVNLQFRTDDYNNYQLKKEIDINDIF